MRSPRRLVTVIVSTVPSLASTVKVVVDPFQRGAVVDPTTAEPLCPVVALVPSTRRGLLCCGNGTKSATPNTVQPLLLSLTWSASTCRANRRMGLSLMYVAHTNPLGIV